MKMEFFVYFEANIKQTTQTRHVSSKKIIFSMNETPTADKLEEVEGIKCFQKYKLSKIHIHAPELRKITSPVKPSCAHKANQ